MLRGRFNKFTKALAGGLLVIGAFLAFNGLFASQSAAEGARDCVRNSVIYCGAYSIDELRQKYTGDVPGVFAYYGVTSDMVHGRAGNLKIGTITKTGNVIVDGQVVATGVMSAGRDWAPNSIQIPGGFYSSAPKDSFIADSIGAFVWLDDRGNFMGAVIQSCGNPASAVPVAPVKVCDATTGNIIEVGVLEKGKYDPVDSPKCKDIQLCRLSDKKIVTIKQATYDSNKAAYSTNLADCAPPVKVCDPSTGNIISVPKKDEGKYAPVDSDKCKEIELCRLSDKKIVKVKRAVYDNNQSAYSTNPLDCAPPVEVCDIKTGTIITVPKKDEGKYLPVDSSECKKMKVCDIQTGELNKVIRVSEFDKTKYSTNPDDCVNLEVCYPETKTIGTIKKFNFNADTMTTDLEKCKEVPVIPSTGIESILGGMFGSGALGYGAFAYASSRRAILRSAQK